MEDALFFGEIHRRRTRFFSGSEGEQKSPSCWGLDRRALLMQVWQRLRRSALHSLVQGLLETSAFWSVLQYAEGARVRTLDFFERLPPKFEARLEDRGWAATDGLSWDSSRL